MEDKEIVDSSKSVEWQIYLNQPKEKPASPPAPAPEPKKEEPDDEPDYLEYVDLITDELMEIMASEAQNDPELVFDKPLDEEQFKGKFPFNIKPPEPEPVIV
jgi:hypothetical protein